MNKLFRKPTPLEVATREMVEAEHARLAAQTAQEYAASAVQYNNQRIARLGKYINELTSEVA